jgi:hypothetical protein
MHLNTWLIYLLAAIGLSLSPGPNGLLALTHGALHGWRKALYTIGGGAFGFTAVIALSMFGIGALLKASLVWLTVMKWLGGAYLVWLGIQAFRGQGSAFALGRAAKPISPLRSARISTSVSTGPLTLPTNSVAVPTSPSSSIPATWRSQNKTSPAIRKSILARRLRRHSSSKRRTIPSTSKTPPCISCS